jgi:hypothetical protein
LIILRNKLADLFVLNELAEMGLKCELSYRQAGLGGFSGRKWFLTIGVTETLLDFV